MAHWTGLVVLVLFLYEVQLDTVDVNSVTTYGPGDNTDKSTKEPTIVDSTTKAESTTPITTTTTTLKPLTCDDVPLESLNLSVDSKWKKINITWEQSFIVTSRTHNISFILQYESGNQTIWDNVKENVFKPEVDVVDIDVEDYCTTLNVRVVSTVNNENGAIKCNRISTFRSPFLNEVGISSNLNVNSSSNTSILRWSPPSENNKCIISYNVTLKSSESEEFISRNLSSSLDNGELDLEVSVTPCTSYVVTVFAINNVNKSGKGLEKSFQTMFNDVEAIRNFTSIQNEKNIALAWQGGKCFKKFTEAKASAIEIGADATKCPIVLEDACQNIVDGLSVKQCNFKFCSTLKSCTNYTFVLEVKDTNNLVALRNTTETTREGVPSEVQNLKATSDSHDKISLTWDAPVENNHCISNYTIEYKKSSDSLNLKEVAFVEGFVLKELTSCMTYEIMLFANTFGGLTGEKISITAMTMPQDSDLKITQLKMEEPLQTNAVTLFWQSPICSSKIEQYEIDAVSFPTTAVKCHKDVLPSLCNGISCNATCTGLEACASYNISVTVKYKNGDDIKDVRSEIIMGNTSEVAPDVPQSLKVLSVSPTEVQLSWSQPKTLLGCASKYCIKWKLMTNKEWNIVGEKNVSGLQYTVNNLSPCGKYLFEVKAASSTGIVGNETTVNITTTEAVPGKPRNLQIRHNVNSAQIEWEQPSTNADCVFSYVGNLTETNSYDEKIKQSIPFRLLSPNMTIDLNQPHGCSIINFEVLAQTANLKSGDISWIKANTPPVPPPSPIQLSVPKQQSDTLKISWIPPNMSLNWCGTPRYDVTCISENTARSQHMCSAGPGLNWCEVSNLDAFTNYNCSVSVVNEGGRSSTISIATKTKERPPGSVENLAVSCDALLSGSLSWESPSEKNGIINHYTLQITATRNGFDTLKNVTTFDCANEKQKCSSCAENKCAANTMKLLPERVYKFQISASTIAGEGEAKGVECITVAGIPNEPSYLLQYRVRISADTNGDPARQAILTIPRLLFDDIQGTIQSYAVLVSKVGHEEDPNINTSGYFGKEGKPLVNRWDDDHLETYQATSVDWNPFKTKNTTTVTFTIGSDKYCETVKSEKYCNGYLEPETNYQVRIRAFTANTYRDTTNFKFKTEATSVTTAVALSLSIVVCIIGLLGAGIYCYRNPHILSCRKMSAMISRTDIPRGSPSIQLVPPVCGKPKLARRRQRGPIRLDLVADYYSHLMDKMKMKLVTEFQELQACAAEFNHSSSEAQREENRPKNRYINILPFDHSRVALNMLPGEIYSDYINGTFVKGFHNGKEYIATQGPKAQTIADFWRMIWEKKVKVIIMLTQCVEDGKPKCEQYWPDEGSDIPMFGDISVKLKIVAHFSHYIKRLFLIQKDGLLRPVTQLHFVRWGDHDRPGDTGAVLDFVRVLRENQDATTPTVVHCSAGVGRTGTLIALDILLYQAMREQHVDVFDTVLTLREQRPKMVQNQAQYGFIYECLRDAILDPNFGRASDGSQEPIYENLNADRMSDDQEMYANVRSGAPRRVKSSLETWSNEDYGF